VRRAGPSDDRGGAAGRPPLPAKLGVPPRPGAAARGPGPPPPAPPPTLDDGAAPGAAEQAAPGAAAGKAPARSVRVADVVTASLLMALGWLVLVAAVRMGIGWGSDGPESGFVPFWLSTVLILCCGIIVVKSVRRARDKAFVRGEELRRVLTVLVPAAAMIALTPYVGLYVASALYMGGYMKWGGRHSWPFSILLPLAFVILVFLVFEKWFLVPLPKGPVETWLGH
jgi:putative tricarboxylic transport membrane protein